MAIILPLTLSAQTRGLVPEQFITARPPAVTAAPRRAAAVRPVSQIGITIWRLRPSTASDNGARILVQEENHKPVEFTPERVASTAKLSQGDHVRLSIEAPAKGYLYVFDRERYAAGKTGEPYLIFPTTRTRGGDNAVEAGKLIDIPGQTDSPNYFTLRQSRAEQSGEELIVLVTQRPLEEVSIEAAAQKIPEAQLRKWEQAWGSGRMDVTELQSGAGAAWTRAEQEAASGGTRLLTQEDPAPQTIYRAAALKPGEPMLVKVQLRYR